MSEAHGIPIAANPPMALALVPAAVKSRRRPRRLRRIALDPGEAADAAQLRYVSDARPGVVRVRHGRAFRYVGPTGDTVDDLPTLRRIRSLAIPPAWTDVWICPVAHGHIQAVGRDARGRKQYRYHARWRAVRDEAKFDRVIQFGRALSAIRERVEKDLGRPGLPREKVLASVVRLLETTLIRVGNAEYARDNGSYGLTTLRMRHVTVEGARLRFEFRGKGGKHHTVDVSDRRLAAVVRRCQDLPGHELFQYLDEDGQRQVIGSTDVNAYLREIAGEEFTAKDFRTWGGTVLAALALAEPGEEGDSRRRLTAVITEVAARLGNTPTICRKCYIHPDVVAAHADGSLAEAMGGRPSGELSAEEAAVLRLLERRAGRRA
ncbi:MAG TPA: DNA topoisomerase IB [Methylomirabilota bacterium]|nr:DNA topoisomerase IB [Methylomirabilota bacterium]